MLSQPKIGTFKGFVKSIKNFQVDDTKPLQVIIEMKPTLEVDGGQDYPYHEDWTASYWVDMDTNTNAKLGGKRPIEIARARLLEVFGLVPPSLQNEDLQVLANREAKFTTQLGNNGKVRVKYLNNVNDVGGGRAPREISQTRLNSFLRNWVVEMSQFHLWSGLLGIPFPISELLLLRRLRRGLGSLRLRGRLHFSLLLGRRHCKSPPFI